ncbi:DMT family transporter [Aeromicrobium sp. CTD01-1L150]|uniref:EamA family transporter n=1 Tax=Aeromicrobium sp. CTD01-1L150 TaxID=3341830 RepID=UPI0035C22F72
MQTDTAGRTRGTMGVGLSVAVLSAAAFATSGPLGRVLLDAGWSPGAAVAVRVLGAAVVLTIPAAVMLRGRWRLLRTELRSILGYGVLAVAATQLCFFYAVGEIDVGVALLIEYTAIIAIVGWMWVRHSQRPTRLTSVGAAIAIVGLVLVLDLLSGANAVNLIGVLWALGAMLGLASYFVLSGDQRSPLPPLVLVWAGLLVGGLVLVLAATLGVLPWRWNTETTHFAFASAPWWVPVAGLVLLAASLAYWTGVVAARRLGPRLASFVGLIEVVAAVFYAWLLLHQLPTAVQLLGGVLILLGIIVAKAGEPQTAVAHVDAVEVVPHEDPAVEDARRNPSDEQSAPPA